MRRLQLIALPAGIAIRRRESMADPARAARHVRVDRIGERQRAGNVHRAGALRQDVGQRQQPRGELQRDLPGREPTSVVVLAQQQRRRAGHRGRRHARARQREVVRPAGRPGTRSCSYSLNRRLPTRGQRHDVDAGRDEIRLGEQIETRRAARARIGNAIVAELRRAVRVERADANRRRRVARHADAAVCDVPLGLAFDDWPCCRPR